MAKPTGAMAGFAVPTLTLPGLVPQVFWGGILKVCESESRPARSPENTGHKEAGHMTQERRHRGQRGDISKKGGTQNFHAGQFEGKAFQETGRRERA